MSEVKVFKYKTALARKMAAPGGLLVETALTAAEGALEGHRDAAMVALGIMLTELETASAARTQADIYPKAAELLDMAGFFETGPLHPALFSLCEVADPSGAGSHWDWPSVDVHLRAIRMIMKADCRETEEGRVILDGLSTLRQRAQRRAQADGS